MFESTPSTLDVRNELLVSESHAHTLIVVPSKMNPVGAGDKQFAALFEAMPARRVGKLEDIAGAVIYLCSQAGVSWLLLCAFG